MKKNSTTVSYKFSLEHESHTIRVHTENENKMKYQDFNKICSLKSLSRYNLYVVIIALLINMQTMSQFFKPHEMRGFHFRMCRGTDRAHKET